MSFAIFFFFVHIWSGVFLIILLMPKNAKFVLMQEAQSAFDQFKQAFASVPTRALQNLSLLRLMHSAMWSELHLCNIRCPKMNSDYVHWNPVSLHNNTRILRSILRNLWLSNMPSNNGIIIYKSHVVSPGYSQIRIKFYLFTRWILPPSTESLNQPQIWAVLPFSLGSPLL